jgi:hypothetical protein
VWDRLFQPNNGLTPEITALGLLVLPSLIPLRLLQEELELVKRFARPNSRSLSRFFRIPALILEACNLLEGFSHLFSFVLCNWSHVINLAKPGASKRRVSAPAAEMIG